MGGSIAAPQLRSQLLSFLAKWERRRQQVLGFSRLLQSAGLLPSQRRTRRRNGSRWRNRRRARGCSYHRWPRCMWDGAGPNFSRLNYAQYVRPDGFQIGGSDGGRIPGIQINGVRAFDPALGSWTSPDAFEGDIHDPASQQKYMWNRGNPVDYSDPSGFEPFSLWDLVFRITHPWNSGEALKLSPNALKPFAERMDNFAKWFQIAR
jgi:RHS repeat-associated protein